MHRPQVLLVRVPCWAGAWSHGFAMHLSPILGMQVLSASLQATSRLPLTNELHVLLPCTTQYRHLQHRSCVSPCSTQCNARLTILNPVILSATIVGSVSYPYPWYHTCSLRMTTRKVTHRPNITSFEWANYCFPADLLKFAAECNKCSMGTLILVNTSIFPSLNTCNKGLCTCGSSLASYVLLLELVHVRAQM